MKSAVFAGYSAVTLILLMLTFRIDEFMKHFHFNKIIVIASYLVVTLMLTLIALVLAPALTHFVAPRLVTGSWLKSIASAVLTLFVFCLVSLLFGPGGLEIPGTQIRAIFFSEWDFVKFILYDAILLAALAGAVIHFVNNQNLSGS